MTASFTYTWTDSDSDAITVNDSTITIASCDSVRRVNTPKGEDAKSLAEAALIAGGLDDHIVISKTDLADGVLAALRAVATPIDTVEDAK